MRHRDQVRARPLRRGGAAGPQRAEHPVEQLEVGGVGVLDRLRSAGRARGPHHERDVVLVAAAPARMLDAVAGDERGGRRSWPARASTSEAGLRGVDRHVHAARQPHADHRPDQLGPVRQLHGDGPAGRAGRAGRRPPAAARRAAPAVSRAVDRVQQASSSPNGWSSSRRRGSSPPSMIAERLVRMCARFVPHA